jgi:hypothetical protein
VAACLAQLFKAPIKRIFHQADDQRDPSGDLFLADTDMAGPWFGVH